MALFQSERRIQQNLIVVKPALGFTLPWAGASPCTQVRIKMRRYAPVRTFLERSSEPALRFIFCVIVSAAKDLDGRSDDRVNYAQLSKSAKDRLVTLGGVSLDSKFINGGQVEKSEVP
jgi:hypothetical protein